LAEPKPYFNVIKNEASREATIYIYGVIGGVDSNTWEEINTANLFSNAFRDLEQNADTIHVRINSPGGYVFEGLAIYNTIIASEKKIITYNDGLCASMAALILLSGDEIRSFINSLLMLHNSSAGYYGNKKQVEEQLKASDKIDKALGTTIQTRLNITEEAVNKDYLNYEDNWFNADECLELGFYDNLIEKKKAKIPKDVINMNASQRFQEYAAMSFKIPKQKLKTTNTTDMSNPNSFPNLVAVLGAVLATTDNGSYINDEQKAAIDNKMAADALAIQTANEAKTTAETALQAEKDSRQAAIDAEKSNTTAAVTALRAAATEAGVEDLATEASMEDIQAALTAQIATLNKKPGATHTGAGSQDDDSGEFAYLDFNNSIYKDLK